MLKPADIKECPDCAGTNVGLVQDKDQLVCRDCGLIFEPLDPETEERFIKTHSMTPVTKKTKPKKRK